ncbi:3-methyl-2-oxobutanoate hydroxymethyltransferase [Dethiosulfatarculus sandiegensis]|uniref:3-methyl-2-oxobutanoate hydroxymethyltransferase n=1 Tax=Dethiosulfatarculus sandiegensis TaxID=1429043 RepID=A0A0D2JIZ2_9BACT|nr:3-methyl-2-oxobutanoate hydroxymethyltransferase [Dethiosulfatarculus sandiegensis]KIX15651.1 3-methyl-2-oxobutanoate hydroxymethyltransferase [Dethiosulfatarculus sandiegensis]
MSKKKLSRIDLQNMKDKGEKAVWMTAYDFTTAQLAEQAGMDMLLVGDSLGMVVYGYNGTVPVTMDQSIYHTEAVRRGAPNTFIIGDMPFGTYQAGWDDAVKNAVRFHKEAGVDCIKLEGGVRVADTIEAITDGGMLVMGHVGLTPQSTGALGGFKAQGRTADSAMAVIEDAMAVYEAGAFSLLVEAVPPEVTKIIADELPIPVYSIGAGVDCDGQVMIVSDILGVFQAFTPKFVKKYANLGAEMQKVFETYIKEVKAGEFPAAEHTYKMVQGEFEKLQKMRTE